MYWSAHRNEEPDYHDITDVESECLELRQVVDLKGTKLLDRVLSELLQIVPEMSFEGAPSREDFSGPAALAASGIPAAALITLSCDIRQSLSPLRTE